MYKTIYLVTVFVLLVSPLYARFTIRNGESFHYRETAADKTAKETVCTYSVDGDKFSYEYRSPGNEWSVVTDSAARPISIRHRIEGNEFDFSFEGSSVHMRGMWNGAPVEQRVDFNTFVTGENALLLRCHDFDREKSFSFMLLQPDKYPELKAFKMSYTFVGTERVQVPAGSFNCRKIQFSLAGAGAVMFRAYYYITDDDRRIIVKSENMPLKGESVLLKIADK